MVLVRAVREVHANDIQTSPAEHVDFLHTVGLWADGAYYRRPPVIPLWAILGVQIG